jgi:hypothetical protein
VYFERISPFIFRTNQYDDLFLSNWLFSLAGSVQELSDLVRHSTLEMLALTTSITTRIPSANIDIVTSALRSRRSTHSVLSAALGTENSLGISNAAKPNMNAALVKR